MGHEWQHPSVKTFPEYQDPALIEAMWGISPYRHTLLVCASRAKAVSPQTLAAPLAYFRSTEQKGVPKELKAASLTGGDVTKAVAEWDNPKTVTFSQPVEGFCGHGSLNTVLRSVRAARLISVPRMIAPMSIPGLVKTLQTHADTNVDRIKTITPIHLDPKNVSYDQFKAYARRANEPNTRVILNFLRAALFFARPSGSVRLPFDHCCSGVSSLRCTCAHVMCRAYAALGIFHLCLRNVSRAVLFINHYFFTYLSPSYSFLLLPSTSTQFGRAFALMGGHWSPLGSVLDNPEQALVLDVNESYVYP